MVDGNFEYYGTLGRLVEEALQERVNILGEVGGMSREIGAAIALGNAVGVAVVAGRDVVAEGRTLVETRQTIEDASFIIINKEYAQTAGELLVPERVGVVEEAEVADEAEGRTLGAKRKTCRNGERAFDAVDAAVAIGGHRQAKVLIGPTYGGAVPDEDRKVFWRLLPVVCLLVV